MRILPVTSFATKLAVSCAIGVFAISVPVAQADERDDVLAAVQACLILTDNTARLACMDAATAALEPDAPAAPTAPEPKPTVPVPTPTPTPTGPTVSEIEASRADLARQREALEAERLALEEERVAMAAARTENEEVKETRRRGGGLLSAPRGLGLFDRDDRPKRYSTNVTRIVVNAAGRHFFETTDGTRWRQVPPTPLTAPSSLPAPVTIRRSASGARRLAFEEHPRRSYVVVETSRDED